MASVLLPILVVTNSEIPFNIASSFPDSQWEPSSGRVSMKNTFRFNYLEANNYVSVESLLRKY